MRSAVFICAGCAIVVAIASMFVGSYFGIRASQNRRPDSRRWLVRANPLNAVLFKDELTPEGLKYRTKAFRMQRIAFISIALFVAGVAILALTETN